MKNIQVFVRYCHYSSASAHKTRLSGFSREKCFQNLMATTDFSKVDFTFFLDTFHPTKHPHFILEQERFPVIQIKAGCEALSFLQMVDYVNEQPFSDDTIIYFLEDDYLHRPGWVQVLEEGLSLPKVSYVTLFDHRDKYFDPIYKDLTARLFHTKSCHWRSTPSTTNTYAMRLKTLKKDLPIHRSYSIDRTISADHDKFCHLQKMGALLVSSIPGFSTHAEPDYASPCIDWN